MCRKTNYAQIDLWYPALLCYLSKSSCFPKIMESDLPLWWFVFISKAHVVINITRLLSWIFFKSLTRSYLDWQGSHEQPFLRLFLLQWAFPSSHYLGFSVPFVQTIFEYPCTYFESFRVDWLLEVKNEYNTHSKMPATGIWKELWNYNNYWLP